jgi:RNA polymerase sigma factor (sigma-70 family)
MSSATRLSLLNRLGQTTHGRSWTDFAAVYDEIILGWLKRQGVSAEDADDIRQEVMLTVYKEISNFEHSGRRGAFRCWLRRITANRMHQFWEKRQRRGETGPALDELADQLADDKSRITKGFEAEHNHFVLEYLLNQLADRFSDKHLLAFRRVVLEEMPAQEVAQDLGMTLGAIRVAQHRILRALKKLGQGLID